jgi:hypothetical protein
MKHAYTREKISRRDFMKSLGIAAAGLAVTPLLSGYTTQPAPADTAALAPVASPVLRYRGAPGGKIMASYDDGQSWQVLTSFGPEYQVQQVQATPDGLEARLLFQSHPFDLISSDGRIWYTPGMGMAALGITPAKEA